MTRLRLARRLGLDGNPLRRRTDKFAAWLAALLAVVFVIGAPWLSAAAVTWVGRTGAGRGQAAPPRYVVPAVLQRASWKPSFEGRIPSISLTQARWAAPDGRESAGAIPVRVGLAAGRTVPLWVDAAGWPAGPPPSHPAVLALRAVAAVMAAAALAIVLLCLAWAGRWVLDRRRLAGWEADWAAAGPQLTKRFWSRG
jgi:hypothetical protein